MAMDASSKVEDAEKASLAFKAVVVSWLTTKEDASSLAALLTFLDVVCLGALWYATGDLTAAAVAGLCVNGVDHYYLHQQVTSKQRNGAKGSS